MAAAAACDAAGYENLARVLRNDVTSAALRKRDMIALARHWGYRSHIWRCDALKLSLRRRCVLVGFACCACGVLMRGARAGDA
jgi:hypothetical protein